MSSNKPSSGFGRDEMNLLLGVTGGDESKAGVGTAGTALLQSRGYSAGGRKQDGKEVDIASLSTAETAALLQQQQANKGPKKQAGSRHRVHRTQKRMQHHELLEQELRAKQLQEQQEFQANKREEVPEKGPAESESEEEEEEADFAAARQKKKGATKRIQLEPQIVAQKDDQQRSRQRRRRRSSSSDSSSSEGSSAPARRRRQKKDSSPSDDSANKDEKIRQRRKRSPSSSDSSSEDEARQRRLKKRQQLDAQKEKEPAPTSEPKDKIEPPTSVKEDEEPKRKVLGDKAIPKKEVSLQPSPKEIAKESKGKLSRNRKESSASDSSSSGSSDDDESTSSSSSSEEDEPAPAMAKPLFVPKHKRQQLAKEKLELETAQKEQEELAKKQEERRKMESRSLVAQVVAATNAPSADDATSEDEDAQAERMLNDNDDVNPEEERDVWEVRELERLLAEIDRLKKIEQEEAEYRRRQQLTDEEARAEDIASGRYQKPGSNRMATKDKDGPQYLQKYFHRGAYYMDEDEFDEDDVRRRAKEYEQGVTESAKNMGDIRKLPKVMQVKQFGRANQSQYQGLSKEDTSRKDSSTLLPLVHHKNPQQRKTTDIPSNKHKNKDE